MSRRSLRHPFGGGRWFLRPAKRTRPGRQPRVRQPRIRPRRQMNVAALVASPEERSSRPSLRLTIVGVIVLVLFGVMVLRLWTLQVIDTKTYAAAVNANHLRSVVVPAPRGDIVDRTGTALVDNAVSQDIVISAKLRTTLERPSVKTGGKVVLLPLTQSQKTEIGKIAALVNLPPRQVESAIENEQLGPYQNVPILPNAPAATVQFLQAHQAEYPGISVQSTTQRSYPQGGTVAPQTLGYTATSPKAGQQYLQVGEAGLEAQYNKYLTGTPGKQLLEVNAAGTVVGTVNESRPIQGDTLVTNLDIGLQEVVQNALTSVVAADRAASGATSTTASNAAAVVMNVNNGQVLAMASYPYYDNNWWVGGISEANYHALSDPCQTTSADAPCPLDNFAIQGLYTPGSTFKLITATAALNTGLITPSYGFNDSTGSYTIPGCTGPGECTFHDDESAAGGPDVTVADALTISDDDFFYNLGVMFWDERATYGDTPIQDTANAYSEGEGTGIDLPNESKGQIDSPALEAKEGVTWTSGDNLELAFGQGATVVTPIEEADAYATFANGGTRYAPEVGSAVVSPSDKVVREIEPKVAGHITMSAANHAAILQGLEGVINSPSGTANETFQQYATPQALALNLAGKTGTADVSSAAAGEEPNAWFVSFGPNPNPQYVVAVVVANAGYGTAAAAPAAAQIWNYLAANPIPSVTLPSSRHPVSEAKEPTPTTTTTTGPGATTTAPGTPATTTPTAAATGTG